MTLPDGGDRTRVPRGVRPRGRRAGPRPRRHRPRRGIGAGRVHRGAAALAFERPAAEPGGLDHHHGEEPRDRSAPARSVARGSTCPGGAHARARRTGGGGGGVRRPAAADLHLLPSRPGARRPGGAHAAPARRPDDGRDRAGVPDAGSDDGAAAGEGEGQDSRCGDSVPHTGHHGSARSRFARCSR